jgi:hypothetical protein
MRSLKPWFDLEPGGVVVRAAAEQPVTGGWRRRGLPDGRDRDGAG